MRKNISILVAIVGFFLLGAVAGDSCEPAQAQVSSMDRQREIRALETIASELRTMNTTMRNCR